MGSTKQRTPRGVTIRKNRTGETINISFMFRGIRCREPLSGLPVTTGNINYAGRLLAEIYNKIERKTFNYAEQFPNSKALKKLGYQSHNKTVLTYLTDYIAMCEIRGAAASTIKGYKGYLAGLTPLHSLKAMELTPGRIKDWIIGRDVKIKTLRNQFSLLRAAIEEAITEGVIAINPCSQITVSRYKDISQGDTSEYVDPFTPDEIERVISAIKQDEYKNQVLFSFNTGMRPSEVIALDWGCIDLVKKIARVESAMVLGTQKAPKTTSSFRDIELNDAAIQALVSQKKYTFLAGERVFINPFLKQPWPDASKTGLYWKRALLISGVRYRNQYQTRHTFATKNISAGVNLFWLCRQMGHTSPEMLFKHYGRYLKEYDGNISILSVNDTHSARNTGNG